MYQNKINCPKCRREISCEDYPFDLLYCTYCGEKMKTAETAKAVIYCLYCGQKLIAGAAYCPRCGKKQVQEPVAVLPPEAQPAYIPQADTLQVDTPPVAAPQKEPEVFAAPQAARDSLYSSTKTVYPTEKTHLTRGIWADIQSWFRNMTVSLKDFFSGQHKVKRLYRHWLQHDKLPEDAIPTDDDLLRIMKESGGEPYRPLRLTLTLLAIAAIIALFILVGIWIRSCG